MAIDPASIITLASEAAGAFNGIVKRLPTKEERQLRKFYEFLDTYYREVTREDSDFDDVLSWKERKKLMLETFLKKIER